MNITQIIEAGLVRRYHTEPIPIIQTNSQHQWGVAVILLHIAKSGPYVDMEKLRCAALLHDVPERIAGDMPAPFKWSNPEISKMLDVFELEMAKQFDIHHHVTGLTEEEASLLKLADYLEAASFSYSIYRQGVQFGLQIFHNLYIVLQGQFAIQSNRKATEFLNTMLQELRGIVSREWTMAHPPLITYES